MANYYWCRTCGRFSSLAEVARFGVRVFPYVCPGCVVETGDGKVTIQPGTNVLVPWPDPITRQMYPTLPDNPVVGAIYKPPDSGATP
jgi:hypothetical protein